MFPASTPYGGMTSGCFPRSAALTDICENLPVLPPSSKVKNKDVDVDSAMKVDDFYPSVLELVLLKKTSNVPEESLPLYTRRSA